MQNKYRWIIKQCYVFLEAVIISSLLNKSLPEALP